jgi:hypothetical protein
MAMTSARQQRLARVPSRLRNSLAASRATGRSWERAWKLATEDALIGVWGEDRKEWRAALGWSKDYWRRAYLGVEWDVCYRPIYRA